MKKKNIAILMFIVLCLSGCQNGVQTDIPVAGPTATMTPIETPEPVEEIITMEEVVAMDGEGVVTTEVPDVTGVPVAILEPTATPEPTVTLASTATPEPTATLEPTVTPESTATPELTVTPEPIAKPKQTATPKPTATPIPKLPIKTVELSKAKVGDYVLFGLYEQDNNLDNGKEEVMWRVMEIKDGKVMLFSKYALDNQPYNKEFKQITWEKCTLRKWLNSTFYNAAFNDAEKKRIVEVTLKNKRGTLDGEEDYPDTKDKVFLLSHEDTKKYFPEDMNGYSNQSRVIQPTAYAISQGADVSNREEWSGNCYWTLRTPGAISGTAATVVDDGWSDYSAGGLWVHVKYPICPAIWVDFSDDSHEVKSTNGYYKAEVTDFSNTEINVGDNVFWGVYEQDNNFENGKELIEWHVLEVKNGSALLLSKYGLDCKPYYDQTYSGVNWENSQLRGWLNGDFLITAFTDTEIERIVLIENVNKDNPNYDTDSGDNTWDQVFLLSLDEAEEYFPENTTYCDNFTFYNRECNMMRAVKATEYAVAQGAQIPIHGEWYDGNCDWWLRTKGIYDQFMTYVSYTGFISEIGAVIDGKGDRVTLGGLVVRPAMWVALGELEA